MNAKSTLPALLALFALPAAAALAATTQPFVAPDNVAYASTASDPVENPATSGDPGMAAHTATGAESSGDSGTVKFATGGVGDDGMRAINSASSGYNLKAMFVATNGEYLADVEVKITTRSGTEVLNTSTSGPVLLAKLAPGTYTLAATSEGTTRSQKVTIGKSHFSSFTLRFPAQSS